ncbi:universal stress protein [Aquibacillus albus]|uniref:Nucleotide-binding universal stress UspA family protein n=1 Tax=Aquibacillus albus TaxID=1168171 RepID=A0ABS2N254_9BACI|nr:universal stress protein [Aquibacillus albus]MBM7572178.1 nucleotide-binding universal stress UspA family protein [Aquibacillus albus]
MEKILLVPINDDSEQSQQVIDYAVQIARVTGFTIELFHVQPKINTHYATKMIGKKQLELYKEECATKLLNKGKESISEDINVITIWKKGIPADEICKEAKNKKAFLIVMGTKNMKKVTGRLIGSTCYRVVRHAPCPVTIVS